MKSIKDKVLYSLLFFLFVIIDQVSKYFFSANEFKNYYFAFSIRMPVWLMYFAYVVMLAALIFWFYKQRSKKVTVKLGFVLVLSGALSNIAERIILGYARDFIHIHTGVFNLADFMIIGGLVLLILS